MAELQVQILLKLKQWFTCNSSKLVYVVIFGTCKEKYVAETGQKNQIKKICRRGKLLNNKVKRINFLLRLICEENGYFFIDNSNVDIRGLWNDGIHLFALKKT